MKHWRLIAVCALVAVSAAASHATAQYKAEFRNSLVVGPTGPWGEAAVKFADLLKERTQGRIKVVNYFDGRLFAGKQTTEFKLLDQGVADFAIGSTINWSPQVQELNLFSMPFLMPDYKAIDALTGGEVGKKLFDIIASKDIVPLAWGENGFRELTNSKRAVRTPDDLKGLKVRVVGSPFTALGANPTQMSWADAQPALSTGAVDGQENPLTIFTVAKLHTVGQKHVTLWHYVADPPIFAVAKSVWETFTPDDQKILRAAALEAGRYGLEIARKGVTPEDQLMLKDIGGLGVEIWPGEMGMPRPPFWRSLRDAIWG